MERAHGESGGPEPQHRLVDLLVAAEMACLEQPHVVVSIRSSDGAVFAEGPYPDGFRALTALVELEDAPDRDDGARFVVAPLWPNDPGQTA